MSSKFMKIKRIVIPMMTFILLSSQLIGCATFKPTEMVEAINQGESIILEVAEPSYTAVIKGEQIQEVTWIQLDQLKTFNTGFRQSFDKAFNITIVSENGMSGKSGSLFINSSGERDGNTTLQSAFRNKVFVTKYWSNTKVSNELIKISKEAYTDIQSDDEALYASLNAYYNLLNDAQNPDSFNASQALSREQFYTLVYKSTAPVDEISATEDFTNAVGGETEYTKYAEQLADSGFLQADNKSLDSTNISGNITRAEAVYMVVNTLFPDELAKVTDKDKAYTDTKNSGDLALKCGFKDKVKVDGQKEKKIIEKDKWQAYVLAYSLQNPDKGMQEDIYKTLVVAKNLNLLEGTESRWDETLSKKESLELLSKAFLAQNALYGYLSEAEHGTINPNNFTSDTPTEETDNITPITPIAVEDDDNNLLFAVGDKDTSATRDESLATEKIEVPDTPSAEEILKELDPEGLFELDANGDPQLKNPAKVPQAPPAPKQPATSSPSTSGGIGDWSKHKVAPGGTQGWTEDEWTEGGVAGPDGNLGFS